MTSKCSGYGHPCTPQEPRPLITFAVRARGRLRPPCLSPLTLGVRRILLLGIPDSWGHRRRAWSGAPPTALSLLLSQSSPIYEVFPEKGPLTCEVTPTQALGSRRSRHSQALGPTPHALRCLPLEHGAVRTFSPFFRKAVGSHEAGGGGGQLVGEAPPGLCGETGNLRGKRRKRVGRAAAGRGAARG